MFGKIKIQKTRPDPKRVLFVLAVCVFLLGMATKAEVENVKEEAEKESKPVSTAIGSGKAFEEEVIDSDVTGNWSQGEIEYFRNKKYIGSSKKYSASFYLFPPYIDKKLQDLKIRSLSMSSSYFENLLSNRFYGQVNEQDLTEILRYLILLENEIYARHGYIFEDKDLREFFGKMDWYTPVLKEVKLGWSGSEGVEKNNLFIIRDLKKVVKEGIRSARIMRSIDKEIIIKANWGSGEGEFALEPLNETFIWETYIAVDNEGYIYIADPNNLRINVFDRNGLYVRNFPIPDDFTYVSKYGSSSLLESIGVDDEGHLYFGSSSAFHEDAPSQTGEVILKTDEKGKVLERYSLLGAYVYPLYFCAVEGEVYLSGIWKTGISRFYDAVLPLEYAKVKGKSFSEGILRAYSLSENNNRALINDKSIELSGDKIPYSFNISKDSRVVYYSGKDFVFTYSGRKERTRVPIFWSSYTPGHGFPYAGGSEVKVSAVPFIDKDLNIYCLDGTPKGISVIKYIISQEIW
jgi:hypothetical protein